MWAAEKIEPPYLVGVVPEALLFGRRERDSVDLLCRARDVSLRSPPSSESAWSAPERATRGAIEACF